MKVQFTMQTLPSIQLIFIPTFANVTSAGSVSSSAHKLMTSLKALPQDMRQVGSRTALTPGSGLP